MFRWWSINRTTLVTLNLQQEWREWRRRRSRWRFLWGSSLQPDVTSTRQPGQARPEQRYTDQGHWMIRTWFLLCIHGSLVCSKEVQSVSKKIKYNWTLFNLPTLYNYDIDNLQLDSKAMSRVCVYILFLFYIDPSRQYVNWLVSKGEGTGSLILHKVDLGSNCA